ncbi:hypothetical protein RIF29_25130 [Crotalaria pallida]|uniref:Uncharacterized protein n=1 Tax=Crotalaria pallida TaxID=3830 RepID=A0AAN9ELR8_CROPI
MPSPLQVHRFNPAIDATTIAISNGINRPKQPQTPPHVRFLPLSSTKLTVPDTVSRHHAHVVRPDQCCSVMIQHIDAPTLAVWSVVHRFDNHQAELGERRHSTKHHSTKYPPPSRKGLSTSPQSCAQG